MTVIALGTAGLTADEVIAVARDGARVELADAALDAMTRSRAQVEALAHSPDPVYGVSTGFGALANRHIPADLRVQLQRSLIRSHAAGMGEPVEREVVRALMLLRLKTLASGRTGARPETALAMAALLNAGITPVVAEFGSLGCSGDLAPLAHCALVLMGEGRASGPDGAERPVPELLAAAGITPVELREKEGLALINGTDGMLGMLVMAIADLERLCDVADLTAAMSVEGLLGTDAVFRPELHLPLRPHPAQHHALHRSACQAHQQGHTHQRCRKPPVRADGVAQVSPEHVKTGMRKVEDPHEAEDEGQARTEHEQQQPVTEAVEQRNPQLHDSPLRPWAAGRP